MYQALDELKNIKQKDESERLLLVESLRVKSIETAFHSDLELVIQKAADDLFNQNKKLLEITKSNSMDALPNDVPSNDRENHVNANTARTPTNKITTPSSSSSSKSSSKSANIIALQNEIATLNVTPSTHLFTHSLTYLFTYLLTHSLTYLLPRKNWNKVS